MKSKKLNSLKQAVEKMIARMVGVGEMVEYWSKGICKSSAAR